MIREIQTYPRSFVEAYWEPMALDPHVALISIIDSNSEPVVPDGYGPNVLTVKFDDVNPDGWPSGADYVTMSDSQADKIVKFILSHDADEVRKRLVIHCLVGVSRSGAVATFAQQVCKGADMEYFMANNRHIMPNVHVQRALHRRHKEEFNGLEHPRRKSKEAG